MLFSSSIFVFLFLPVVLALHYSLRRELRNTILLIASLLFYAWGEKFIAAIMVLSILGNWGFGLWVHRARGEGRGKGVIALATVFNLGLLVAFKYADWLWSILSWAVVGAGFADSPLQPLGSFLDPASPWHALLVNSRGGIRLPIGISFFTFQAFSYVLDVYRRDTEVQKNPLDVALFVSLFPQLIAGPIVRYKDVAAQIVHRVTTQAGFAYGIRRFVIGLGKKMLIANIAAKAADGIFGNPVAIPPIPGIPAHEMTLSVSWLGIACYTLQIYFDFSGYSDMAIGLGHMLGFHFLENFNYPYISKSITEFWRRWHMSLSTWFRDYLYVPLGGNRLGAGRTYLNLLIVFFLCGLWHGAAFNFLVWGLYHGAFLVVERVGLGRWLERRAAFLRHAYVLLVVVVGWVFFRSPDLAYALDYLRAMSGFGLGVSPIPGVDVARIQHVDLWLDSVLLTAVLCGILGSTPWLPKVAAWHAALEEKGRRALGLGLEIAGLVGLACIFLSSALELSAGTYNPFIYFRF